MLAIIGGDPGRFQPYVELYHSALEQLGQPDLPVGVHSPGFVADTDEQAHEVFFPAYKQMRDKIGAERGWGAMSRREYLSEVEHGSLYVGSPETVARKIAATVDGLDVQRFDLKYSAGPLAHGPMMRAIELYGTRVIPMVRELLAQPAGVPA